MTVPRSIRVNLRVTSFRWLQNFLPPQSKSKHLLLLLHSSLLNPMSHRTERSSSASPVTVHTDLEASQHQEKQKIVGWEGELADPSNPRGWTNTYKWVVLLVLCNCSLCVTCASSVISNAYGGIKEEFGISSEVATLGLSLFVLGLSLGPLLLGPLSEFYGRRVSDLLFCFGQFWILMRRPDLLCTIK